MAKGGGTSTSVTDIPAQFKPAYYRMFNSAYGAAQQGAQNPFATGAPGGAPVPNPWGGPPATPAPAPPQGGQQPPGPFGTTAPGPTSAATTMPLTSGPPIIGQPFPFPFTAPTAPIEQESLASREAVGRGLTNLGAPSLGLGQAQAMGGFLDPNTNPFFTANIQASLQPAIDAFMRSIAPQFNSQAIQSGAFKGSSARDMAFGNLANDFGRNLMQTAAQQGMQNYLQERLIQQQTPQLLQQAAGLQQLSPEILAQVGAGQRELAQRPLDELLLQFQEAQQAPFRPLGPLASIIQGTNIGTTSTLTPQRPSPVASGIAGGLGGASLGLSLADQLGASGGYAAGAGGLGALLGSLGGIL